MKAALTVWENRISPVFDAAQMFLIAEISNCMVLTTRHEPFDPEVPSRVADRLQELNVSVLICGAISEVPANMIESRSIKLIPFISGNAEDILGHYAKGLPIIPTFLMPGVYHENYR